MGAVDEDILVVGAWAGDHWLDISKAVLPEHNTEPLVALALWLVAPPPCPKLMERLCKTPNSPSG